MSIKKNIGKNTIGDNSKMQVDLRNYNRSTHDLSYIWRNTQSPGTIVPFMCEVGLAGDSWDINLNANVMTHPTVGPLFGTFKLENHIFTAPFRLYNSWLHNNKTGIGMNMGQIKLPQIQVKLNQLYDKPTANDQFPQINPSCLLAYLGLRGYGFPREAEGEVKRNAIPLLSYYDICKNYYFNKQEEDFYTITGMDGFDTGTITVGGTGTPKEITNFEDMNVTVSDKTIIELGPVTDVNKVLVTFTQRTSLPARRYGPMPLVDICSTSSIQGLGRFILDSSKFPDPDLYVIDITSILPSEPTQLLPHKLTTIDDFREGILYKAGNQEYLINETNTNELLNQFAKRNAGRLRTKRPQFGLALKTYQSDLYQNWINTDWIDGANGINELSAIDVSEGILKMDALNLQKKVYDMLNRIAVSGGTYKDWLETVYTSSYIERCETPEFMGGMSQYIDFQEVVSNAATEEEPLGSLAGRGTLVGKQKGGSVRVKCDEPCYIMGLSSITPLIDYSQGNRFDSNFKTIDDLHKPALDGIGYQDLITEGMAWWSTGVTATGQILRRSAGKTVAWIEYMTNVNKTFGNFAINNNEAFMVLNRNYSMNETTGEISDLTTYIDPTKFNYIFADTRLDAMNFWVQIGVSAKVRRVISAKVIPNL